MKKQDEGFTLIELLIVIVILGILATVVVFSVRGITDQGQDSACAADAKTLEVAVEAYYAQYGDVAVTEALLESTDLIRSVSANYNVNSTTGEVYGTAKCA
jgi:general secretion pathway protein G